MILEIIGVILAYVVIQFIIRPYISLRFYAKQGFDTRFFPGVGGILKFL